VTALAALTGAGTGLGLLLVALGVRGVELSRPPWWPAAGPRWERRSLRLALAGGAGVLVGAGTGWPVGALLAALAGFFAPSLAGDAKTRTTALARIEAVAGWAEMLRDTMAGAAGIEQAIIATAPVAPLPLRADVVELAAALEGGTRLAPALRSFADRVADATADLVVAALVMAAEHQARQLGELLGSLAHAAREQATMRMRLEAGRAQIRTSVKVIITVTAGLALGLAILNRGYLAPYASPTGQLVLAAVGALFAAAFAWLARMTRPGAPERILTVEEAR
jgi:tight adherence protein B